MINFEANNTGQQPLELYLHIPFCVRKCRYCDFLSFPSGEADRQRYVDQLTAEIKTGGKQPELQTREISTVFMGGGTPSLLLPKQTEQILDAIYGSFHVNPAAEISMEANPGTLDEERLLTWKRAGINRLSIGLQSSHDAELKLLGRIHTWQQFLESFRLARKAGFDNINVDLMSALPGQTEKSWEETLRSTVYLGPEHISAYSLIVEEGTPFYDSYGAMEADIEKYGEWDEIPENHRKKYGGLLPLPGEEADRDMYHFTKQFLKENGYGRYEISNYAKQGRECRHNIGYWNGTEYLGLGLGAASLFRDERFHVTRSMEDYLSMTEDDFACRKHHEDREPLTRQAAMEEFMFLGLRLTAGISAADFERRFQRAIEAVYGSALSKFREEGLLEIEGEGDGRRYRLTERGLDVSNYVVAGFLI